MTIKFRTDPISMQCSLGGETIPLGTWSPVDAANTKYDAALTKLKTSPKAQRLIAAAERDEEVVEVLVTTNYFNKYFSPGELKKRYGTVLDNNASLIVWDPTCRQPVKTHVAHKPAFLKDIQDDQVVQGNSMDPFMLLVHELGHFHQFLHLPEVYEIMRERTYEEGARGERKTDDGLENENVQHHEAPVAYELGQPIRYLYWDQ